MNKTILPSSSATEQPLQLTIRTLSEFPGPTLPPPTSWQSATFAGRAVRPPSIGSRTVRKPGGVPSTTGGVSEDGGGDGAAARVARVAAASDDENAWESASSFVREMSVVSPAIVQGVDATLSIEAGGTNWSAFVKGGSTMFVKVPEGWNGEGGGLGFKECVVAVLELAETVLGVESLVVCLEKSRADLAHLIRAFMFVGFEMVHPLVYGFGDGYVLVGCDV